VTQLIWSKSIGVFEEYIAAVLEQGRRAVFHLDDGGTTFLGDAVEFVPEYVVITCQKALLESEYRISSKELSSDVSHFGVLVYMSPAGSSLIFLFD
jgi:hypothetical protein